MADLITLLTTDFPDNTVGSITPAILRSYLTQFVGAGDGFRLTLSAVNLHAAATDNAITINLPSNINRFTVDKLFLENLSVGGSTCIGTFGLFTASGGLGSTVVTTTGVTILSTANDTVTNLQSVALTNIFASSDPTIYFRTITASSIALTCDVVLTIKPLT
jgi:hypothetical protein